MSFEFILRGFTLVLIGQDAVMAARPDWFVRYNSWWYYRVIGARPASPGKPELIYLRVMGVATLALSIFVLIQLSSE